MEVKNFNKVCHLLDNHKSAYYLCAGIFNRPHLFEEMLETIGLPVSDVIAVETQAADNIKLYEDSVKEALETGLLVKPDVTEEEILSFLEQQELVLTNGLSTIMDKIKEGCDVCDMKFYNKCGYGEYWNEVELPGPVSDLFFAISDLFAESVPGMVKSTSEVQKGYVALSIYDLSDSLIIFETEDDLNAFLEEANNAPDDPTELMFSDGPLFYSEG